jgi:hypothetical protein
MKKILLTFFALGILWACSSEQHDEHSQHAQHQGSSTAGENTKKSIPSTAMANIGPVHVHIEYTAPAVRERVIWGGLVPYKEIWVTGAHNATSVSFSGDVEIDGRLLKKGKYAFFTIPDKDTWTVIFNTRWKQHLADEYSEAEDVLRVNVKAQENEHTERLRYEVIESGEQEGAIEMAWEKLKITVPVRAVP